MKYKSSWQKSFILAIGLVLFSFLYIQMKPPTSLEQSCSRVHNDRGVILDSLYQGSNSEFMSAGNCDHCHGYDISGYASTDGEGGDVNVVDDWSSSMMALSAKDPFWRAKVSHEVFVNPQFQQEIEGTCTRCHASLGRYAGLMNGVEVYSIDDMLADSVALDGVSCLSCHRQTPQPEVALHTGQLFFSEQTIAYGQYLSPLISPMAEATGYIPEHSGHISDSKLCAGCHSLVTETVDLEGNFTGGDFVEQATWHEWLNSSYPASNTSCQSCHLPRLEGQNIHLAAGYPTDARPDFALHTLAGGNTLMLGLMRDNREALGIFPSEQQFNSTIAATNDNLKNKSVTLEVVHQLRTADTLYIDLKLTNITGHKLPSGYPARRMSLHFVVSDLAGNEIFRSGSFDDNHYIVEEDTPLEPHHNFIASEDDVQIYEMVMGDVNNNRTTVLLRGATHLKDNRLVPAGFTVANAVYDTTEIVLNIPDSDFNFDPAEGSGSDIVHFKIPMNGFSDQINFNAALYYQSLPPVWLEEIFTVPTAEIIAFEGMFSEADKSPVLMKSLQSTVSAYVGISEMKETPGVRVVKGLDGIYQFYVRDIIEMEVYTIQGALIDRKRLSSGVVRFDQQLAPAGYLVVFINTMGQKQIEKLIID
jgi:hypothetical protein